MRIGYACISVIMREQDIFTSRSMTLKTVGKKGLEGLRELARANIEDLEKIINYNEGIGVRFFRISSGLIPRVSDPQVDAILGVGAGNTHNIEFARPALARVGALARGLGHRLTMHPGQFVQLGTPHEKIAAQSAAELDYHADVLLAMGMTTALGSVLVIHGGGVYGDRAGALERWAARYKALRAETRQFIVLENDEHWSVAELLPFCEREGVPLVVDYFHHTLRNEPIDINGVLCRMDIFAPEISARVLATWRRRGIPPKCHLSAQAEGARRGAHAGCIDKIPEKLLDLCSREHIDIMLEVKQKDACLLEVVKRHKFSSW